MLAECLCASLLFTVFLNCVCLNHIASLAAVLSFPRLVTRTDLPPSLARAIACGEVNPITHQPFEVSR